MSRKEYLKDLFIRFLMIHAGISMAMGIVGSLVLNEVRYGYWVFFVPFVFAVCCMIPGIILTEKVRTTGQVILHNLVYVLMLEAIIFGLNYLGGAILSLRIALSLAVSVVLVYLFVLGVGIMFDSKSASQMTEKVREYQAKSRVEQEER